MKYGDIVQLGRHRLMCGDATKNEDVHALVDGAQVNLVLTDPPYGINIVNRKTGQLGGSSRIYAPVIGDTNGDMFIEHYKINTILDALNDDIKAYTEGTKRKEDGMWAITFVGGKKPVKLFKTKKEAEEYLAVLTKNQGATALIRNSKGAKAGKFASSIKSDEDKK